MLLKDKEKRNTTDLYSDELNQKGFSDVHSLREVCSLISLIYHRYFIERLYQNMLLDDACRKVS